MNALTNISGSGGSTSSIELLDMVNEARVEFGEPEIRRNDFTARCKDELDGDHYESFVVENPNGTTSEVLQMTRDQCAWVLMRESKAVRRKVTKVLNRSPAELSRLDILKLALESEQARVQAEAERDKAIATKAQIGSKREATAMATASAARREANRLKDELGVNHRHATIIAVEKALHTTFGSQFWRNLKRWCDEHGVAATKVVDPRWGEVKAWPAEAWKEVQGVDLASIFPAPEGLSA